MDALARQFNDLTAFLPPCCLEAVLPYFRRYPIALIITRERKTRLGDYRPPAKGEKQHRITVNGNLHPYAFLITLLHEIAHLLVFEKHRGQVAPHGAAWKETFGALLCSVVDAALLPAELATAVRQSARNPASATFRDVALSKALNRFDPCSKHLLMAGDLETGAVFKAGDQQVYQVLERRRSRLKCRRLKDGKDYLVPFTTEVALL